MYRLLFVLLCCAIVPATFGQTLQQELSDLEWRIIPGVPTGNAMSNLFATVNPMKQSVGNFEASRCIVSPDEIAVLVNYRKDDYGVLLLDSKLKIKWNTPLTGTPLGMGKLGDKIIIITTPDITITGWKNQFDALLLEPATGKVITRKNIYKGSEDYFMEPKLFFIPKDNSFKLGIRKSLLTKSVKISFFGSGVEKAMTAGRSTSSFELISINGQLETTGKVELPVKKDLQFLDCGNNSEGVLFFSYYEGGQNIGLQRISPDGTNSEDYRHVSFDARDKSGFNTGFFISRAEPDVAYITIECTNSDKDKTLGIYRIDFRQTGNQNDVTVLTKAYKKEHKNDYSPFNKDAGKPDTDLWNNLKTVAVLDHEDKVIVVNEVQFTQLIERTGIMWNTGDAIVSLYDKKMHLQSQVIIPKEMRILTSIGSASSYFIRGNKLYILSANSHKITYNALYVCIDLATGKLLQYSHPDRGEAKKRNPVDPGSTLWFRDGFMVNYLDPSGFLVIKKISTDSQKFSY